MRLTVHKADPLGLSGCVSVALASRCLQLVVHYIPIIRTHFETKLQHKQFSVLRHFDHILKVTPAVPEDSRRVGVLWLRLFVFQDYNDHIAEISAKLVAIMDGLFEKVLSKVCKASRCAA